MAQLLQIILALGWVLLLILARVVFSILSFFKPGRAWSIVRAFLILSTGITLLAALSYIAALMLLKAIGP